MNKAQIKLELNEPLVIDNVTYHVAEHPALPGVPYIQRGARGFVVQLISPGVERFALKYFKLKYRVPELVTVGKALHKFARLPGLRAASRTVFTAQTHPNLIRSYPALDYGMLMPWIPGTTWFDIITRRVALAPYESVRLAQTAAHVLATLEANGLAHCDIAGANVMVERAAGLVELVDIEEMHGPGLPRPVELPAGQEGYQHRTSANDGQWTVQGDRFGGAVLLAEMLTWHNEDIRGHSADEHYFAASEMQQPDSPRYKLLYDILRSDYTLEIAAQFETAWHSAKLRDCPPLSAWQSALGKLDPSKLATRPIGASPSNSGNGIVSGRRALIPGTPSNSPAGEMPTPLHVRVPMKLCPRCGAQNPLNAEFCSNCHYYLRGSQRTAANQAAAKPDREQRSVAHQPSQPPITLPPSSAPPLISARRMVGSGQSGQIIPTSGPPPNEQGDGRGIILALIVGVLIAILFLALLAH